MSAANTFLNHLIELNDNNQVARLEIEAGSTNETIFLPLVCSLGCSE